MLLCEGNLKVFLLLVFIVSVYIDHNGFIQHFLYYSDKSELPFFYLFGSMDKDYGSLAAEIMSTINYLRRLWFHVVHCHALNNTLVTTFIEVSLGSASIFCSLMWIILLFMYFSRGILNFLWEVKIKNKIIVSSCNTFFPITRYPL